MNLTETKQQVKIIINEVFGLSYEAGLGDCTAEALRTLSKEV
jgi:hypothetical protein